MNDSVLRSYLCSHNLDDGDNQSSQDYDSHEMNTFDTIGHVLSSRVMVAICVVGLVGNLCNLFVLVPIGLRSPLARIEKCAYSGLLALAVSDLCFCLCVIPNSWVERPYVETEINFNLIYAAFNNAFINIFVLFSTWLTVTMAIGRYLAICHPLWAREIIGPTIAKRSIVIVAAACVILNLPRFWINHVTIVSCDEHVNFYLLTPGQLQANRWIEAVYNWLYFVIGIAVPFFVLVTSNICLIQALRRSQIPSRLIRHTDRCDPNRVITLTMIIIIIMYIMLVTPAETIHFLVYYLGGEQQTQYNFVVKVVNTLQAINFSFNVILYFTINVSFRRCVFRLFCCCTRRPLRKRASSTQSTGLSYKGQRRVTLNGQSSYAAVTNTGAQLDVTSC
ncbi:hypothetical protein CAPTEDRAFT_190428 [Capitella teleta]|uniref:G-protein coupled receptors family 1 profile domain-containing protein n=1 Tax=Capitella teleta TaxID=283909 RepID=R7T364_CAPTE|nr:hypothetical protein CAPTEDRAFT_190428 [Capitella teleta]|eukprot:ELT86996.1 hypothetical protein CAPTEDRAFT_190428 [Capitella teleta]